VHSFEVLIRAAGNDETINIMDLLIIHYKQILAVSNMEAVKMITAFSQQVTTGRLTFFSLSWIFHDRKR
jgi:hypothetical protein